MNFPSFLRQTMIVIHEPSKKNDNSGRKSLWRTRHHGFKVGWVTSTALEIEFSTMALNIHLELNFCTIFTSQPLRERRARATSRKVWIKCHLSYPFTFSQRYEISMNTKSACKHTSFSFSGCSSPLGWSARHTKRGVGMSFWYLFSIKRTYRMQKKITTWNPRSG